MLTMGILAYQLLCAAMLVAGVLFALLRGGAEERSAATMLLAATAATWGANRHGYAAPELAMMLVDTALFIGLGALALRSQHFWPLWAAAFQLVAVVVHIAMFGQRNPGGLDSALAYAIGLNIWAVPVLGAFLLGMRRRARSAAPDHLPRHGIGDNIGGAT